MTPDELLALGYPAKEVEAVVALSRREDHNMDIRRLDVVDERARERLDRYLQAWKVLRKVAGHAR